MKKFKYKVYDYSNIINNNILYIPADYIIKSARVDLENNTLIIDYSLKMNLGIESISINLNDLVVEDENI
jgi:hypothetical protein